MAEDQGKKDEEKFEFTAEGEALGYISLDQAQVLAMRTARETPGAYGSNYVDVPMAFEVVEDGDTEDHYRITLSFRPQGEFRGRPGREQFFIEKEGAVAHRQVVSLPGSAGWRRYRLALVAIGLVVVVAGAVGGVIATIGRGDSLIGVNNYAATSQDRCDAGDICLPGFVVVNNHVVILLVPDLNPELVGSSASSDSPVDGY